MKSALVNIAKKGFKATSALLIVFVIVRACFLDIYNIPSESMKDALQPNDLVVIDQTLYSGLLSNMLNGIGLEARIKRNDIIVFKLNPNDETQFIKRCVGVPGNIIQLRQGGLLVNNHELAEPLTVRKQYKIWYKNYPALTNAAEQAGVNLFEVGFLRKANYISANLSYKAKAQLMSTKMIDSITVDTTENTQFAREVIQRQQIAYFKDIQIPYKGLKITLTDTGIIIYKQLFQFENVQVKKSGHLYKVNGRPSDHYTFKQNYYFFMGDNRNNSIDSRFFGLIPGTNILGKLIFKFNLK
jgi:signal peptidase I